MKRLCLVAAALCCSLILGAQNTLTVYLSGRGNDDPVEWDFYCTEGRNSGVWTKIAVPSNWECQGFGQYTYGHMKQEDRLNESGVYKRSFDVPREWKGKRVSIVFGGVMTDTQVLVNGKPVGEKHQGGYYEFRYDVSGFLKYGTVNSLEVRVDKSSSDPDVVKAERDADFWVLGGIFRPVWLEVRPQTCIETFALDAKADGSLRVKADVIGKVKDCELVARVRTLDGKAFGDPVRAAVNENGATVLEGSFTDPALWSAEYPNLYYLELDLVKAGEVIHHVDERFGFRTVEVRKADGIYVNGTRIKFRGVNRHSFWPTTGRTLNDRINLEDALLIKEMNMNAVRMSHYPPDRRFLDVCDSLGLYVIDERTGWQAAYGTDICRKLIRELVLRDRNHPSILLWANGNEGGFNLDMVDEYAKWDLQARHVIHPYKDEELTDTFHYPKWNSLKDYLAGIRKIWFPTEFNHGLYDGGHGAGLEDYWDLMYAAPLCAGGFLWDLIDQGLVRDDEGGRLDTDGNHGADGIVGPYREREGSFYAIKDIWCPVQIELMRCLPESFDGRIKIENRYDFTNLRECSFSATFRKIDFLSGSCEERTVELASPDVAPGLKGWLTIPCMDDFALYDVMLLKACGPDGKELYTWIRNISDAGSYASKILEQDKAASGALPLESLRFTSDPGKNAYLETKDAGNGWTEVSYDFHQNGFFDNVGVTFDYPEEKINAVRYLGNGPYRVWKNRMRGATFGLWNLTRNDTATGESWDYPEFKGYRSNMYAADIETEDGIIRLVFASDDLFLRILTPDKQVLRNNDNTLGVFPDGQISVLNAISPVGTKFSKAEETGPQGERNYIETLQGRSGTSSSGRFYIKFIPLPYKTGSFDSSTESLQQYAIPEWFSDAKFGIWSHWGPQAVPREGDWYAKHMYVEGTDQYKYHLATYGHPSEFGYKDIVELWKAERWDPEALMKLYKRVGARYFVSMGTHHDNFFLWDSKLNSWNAVNKGPHKDVVGIWQQAARKEGLYFGVSEHLGASYTWFQSAHGADKEGPYAGVPYDGNDPVYAELYHEKADKGDTDWMTNNPAWQIDWYYKIKELVDMYHPDLLYSDSPFPFDYVGRCQVANLYNTVTDLDGKTQAVYTCKHDALRMGALDVERGAVAEISEYPWQTDTSIGDWYYQRGQDYMTSDQVIQMLIDVVSKNGNLLLNIVQTPEGDLEDDVLAILDGIGRWIDDNGEAIYCSRPWKIYGEGPSMENQEKGTFGGVKDVRDYRAGDVRFTTRDGKLYVFCMEPVSGSLEVKALGKTSPYYQQISSIRMLGSKEKVKWNQGTDALEIKSPAAHPDYSATVYEIQFK